MFNVPKYQFKTFHPNKYVKNVPKTINGPRENCSPAFFSFYKNNYDPDNSSEKKEVNNPNSVILQPRKAL